jgi:GWxTD domain-containing protein
MKKYWWLLVGCLLSSTAVQAQERYLEIVQKFNLPKLFVETATFPASTADSVRLIVNVKVSYNYLVFTKQPDGKFKADVTISSEVLTDKQGAGRRIVRRTAVVDSFMATEDKDQYLSASLELPLKVGEYEAITEILDLNTGKPLNPDKRKLKIEYKDNPPVLMSTPMMVFRPQMDQTDIPIRPIALSGKGIYGKEYIAIVEMLPGQTRPIDRVYYELSQVGENADQFIERRSVLESSIYETGAVQAIGNGASEALLSVKKKAGSGRRLALVDFNAGRLNNARYRLKVVAITGRDTSRTELVFENAWIDLPYPLYDIDLAVRLMEYILSPDALSDMLSGSSNDRMRSFERFWKQKDPTPDTEYNEVMAEYFHRVDHAFFTFYTNQEYGWRTDRGKIYILYGEPSKIRREFPAKQPTREIWIYEKPINRTFVFADEMNNSNYRLIEQKR